MVERVVWQGETKNSSVCPKCGASTNLARLVANEDKGAQFREYKKMCGACGTIFGEGRLTHVRED
jgi:ribosomal protein S27AE